MLIRRHQQVLELLQEQPELSIQDLTERLGVSPATVRRDLTHLASQGLIQRVRGGAMTTSPLGTEPSWVERGKRQLAEKRVIAQAAVGMVEDNQVIALDVGTTTLEIAKLLVGRANLTVFTASVMIAEVLARGRPTVYLVGGRLRARELSLAGPLARETIGRFHFDTFFLGAAGWSIDDGLVDFSIEDVEVKHAFIQASNRVIAVVDSGKYGRGSLMSIAKLSDVDHLITDDGLDETLRAPLEELTDLQVVELDHINRRMG